MLNGLGLFAGIGGLELGLERAGLCTSVCFVENDSYAQKVLTKRFPEVPIWDDVKTFDGKPWEGKIDVISGGFPCQDISVAGKGAGIKEGTRSGLWFEFRRIISEIRPLFAVIENVPMLLVRGGTGVIADLAEIGYNAEWSIISAKGMGAPHLRKRCFIVGYPQHPGLDASEIRESLDEGSNNSKTGSEQTCQSEGPGVEHEELADSKRNCKGGLPKRTKKTHSGLSISGKDVSDTDHSPTTRHREDSRNLPKITKPEGLDNRSEGWWAVEPNVGRVANGVPSRVDRLKCLGNGVVPECSEYFGRLIMEALNGRLGS